MGAEYGNFVPPTDVTTGTQRGTELVAPAAEKIDYHRNERAARGPFVRKYALLQ